MRRGRRPEAIIARIARNLIGLIFILALLAGSLQAQVRRPGKAGLRPTVTNDRDTRSPWAIQRRGQHDARWESILQVTNPATGRVQIQTNAFTVLAAGLHYWHEGEGQWFESREEIEIVDGGAVARHGAHQAAFAANLNVAGAIALTTPEGHLLRSHVLGLAYTDVAMGKSILIGGIQDSVGSVQGNQVHYADAFDGPFRADVRYTYAKSGLEQDVVLVQQPPAPEDYGLDERTTRLEIWTEFLQPPAPERTKRPLKFSPRRDGQPAIADPEFSDETLTFGTMMIGAGAAFRLDHSRLPSPTDAPVPVGKEWLTLRDRTFLVEKVDYSDVKAGLLRLPKAGMAKKSTRPTFELAERSILLSEFVAPPEPRPANRQGRMEFTARPPAQTGYVVDYSIVVTLPNHVFRGDTTYLVLGECVLSGTTVIEGGCVVKWTNGIKNRIRMTGPVDCQTSAYRPAYFLSMNDDTVGEQIPGSSDLPTVAGAGLELEWQGGTISLHDLRFRSLQRALSVGNGVSFTLSHSQILSCDVGVQALAHSTVALRNALLVDVADTTFALADGAELRGEHLTLHRVGTFRSAIYGIPTGVLRLANSLLVDVTNLVVQPYSDWRKVFVERGDAGVFAAAGHGTHYLPVHSPFRRAGDPDIDSSLLTELRRTSTYPPRIISGAILQGVVLRPIAPRNAVAGSNPDIGYAYDAMDYLLQGVLVEGTPGDPVTLCITNGAVLGLDPVRSEAGIKFGAYSSLVSVGRAAHLNRIVPVPTIQEGNLVGKSDFFTQIHGVGLGEYPKATLRLTELCLPAGRWRHFANWGGSFAGLDFQDCRFAGGEFYLSPDSPSHSIRVKNCSFERVRFTFHPYARAALSLYNNLFKDGTLTIDMDAPNPAGSPAWIIRDNLFDGTRVTQLADLPADAATHNGYVLTSQNQTRLRPIPSGNTDRILLASPRYEVFGNGRYYLPSGDLVLTDRGSRSAAAAGLYHHTTRVGQAKEAGSAVDIGLHYIALSGSEPSDVDHDGVSDYWEDQNGDGITNGRETRWSGYESGYRLAGQPGLSVFTPLR